MKVRRAIPSEAEQCWNIRNQAIRQGCRNSYEAEVINAWTPAAMPESFRNVIALNPFFVVEGPEANLVATGFLDLAGGSVEAIFTLPDYFGRGGASLILQAIIDEARRQGFEALTLSATPNAQSFYEKHGFRFLRESVCSSALAQADLRCMEMSVQL